MRALFFLHASRNPEPALNLAALVHELKPFLTVLLLPPVPLLLLVIMGAGLLRQHRNIGRTLLALGVLGLWLGCCQGVADLLGERWLGTPPALSQADIADLRSQAQAHQDIAVIVLGAGARSFYPEYGGPGLKPLSMARLRYGIWLARQIDAPLGFSGGIGWGARRLDQSEAAIAERTAKEEFGLPLKWAESRSRDTRENAAFSLELLRAAGIKKIILVTHDMHMPRAQRAFEEAAQGDIAIVAAPIDVPEPIPLDFSDFLPSGDGFARVRYAAYEWLGTKAGH